MTTSPITSIADELLAELEEIASGNDEDAVDVHGIKVGHVRALLAERAELKRDAERYRWLRNPDQDVSLVLDKVTGHVPVDRFGGGGYPTYEYRAGEDLDQAIDAAMQEAKP